MLTVAITRQLLTFVHFSILSQVFIYQELKARPTGLKPVTYGLEKRFNSFSLYLLLKLCLLAFFDKKAVFYRLKRWYHCISFRSIINRG